MLAPCLALYEQISLPVAGLCTVTFFPVTFFPTCPLFLFFLSLYSYCYPNELLPFFLFLFFPLVHCYFLSCYFFSYMKLLLSFLFLIFPLVHCYFLSCYLFSYLKLLLSFLFLFFPLVHCYFLSCYFFSCYFFFLPETVTFFPVTFFPVTFFRAPYSTVVATQPSPLLPPGHAHYPHAAHPVATTTWLSPQPQIAPHAHPTNCGHMTPEYADPTNCGCTHGYAHYAQTTASPDYAFCLLSHRRTPIIMPSMLRSTPFRLAFGCGYVAISLTSHHAHHI